MVRGHAYWIDVTSPEDDGEREEGGKQVSKDRSSKLSIKGMGELLYVLRWFQVPKRAYTRFSAAAASSVFPTSAVLFKGVIVVLKNLKIWIIQCAQLMTAR